MQLVNQIDNLFWKFLLRIRRRRYYDIYSKQYKNMLNGEGGGRINGEDEFIKNWSRFGTKVEPYSYRFFSHYMGRNPYIIPEDIGHCFISFHLNPIRYRGFYSDKNIYNFIFGNKIINMPQTILRRIDGGKITNDKYEVVNPADLLNITDSDVVVLKPTIDSCSGDSVLLFSKDTDGYRTKKDSKSVLLTPEFLYGFGNDWILQEGVKQHEVMSFFNSSSVNTLRLCTYRSVVDETIHVSSAALRIGKTNSPIDNLHAGGVMVKVDLEDGSVGNKVFDQYGKTYREWNGIDFETIDKKIPSWKQVIEFAKMVTSYYLYSRLLALDISVNQNGDPVLIEINNEGFSFWIPMLLGYDVFCGETENVISYCLKKEKEMKSYKIRLV